MVLKKSIVFTLSGAFAPSLLSYCTTVRTAAGHNFYIFITFIVASNLFLHFTGVGCYNAYRETGMVFMPITKKQPPGEIAALQGAFLCLLALVMSIKPLADVIADHTCCDRHQETSCRIHALRLPLLPE